MKGLAMAGILAAAAVVALPQQARAGLRVRVTVGNGWHSAGPVLGYASDRDWRGGPAFRYGYDRGWREGSEEGHKDGRRRRDPRYWREGDFRDGDSGYKHWMGPRPEYVRGYRDGYAAGYRRAYTAARPGWRDYDRDRDRYPHPRDDDR